VILSWRTISASSAVCKNAYSCNDGIKKSSGFSANVSAIISKIRRNRNKPVALASRQRDLKTVLAGRPTLQRGKS
jgi:hypothetical protein